jgi:hypothetical protein
MPDGSGTAFTAMSVVSGNITVYAQWDHGFDITLNLDAGDGAFSETSFTISKTAVGNPNSRTISITGTGYTNPRWFVDENLEGTAAIIVIPAVDYSVGVHNLSLFISKSGVTWSKEIAFTVTN